MKICDVSVPFVFSRGDSLLELFRCIHLYQRGLIRQPCPEVSHHGMMEPGAILARLLDCDCGFLAEMAWLPLK
jgi:hypothetical protein